MQFETTNDYVIFKFQQQELTADIKSLFNITTADIQYKEGTAKIRHDKIAELNIHEIKKLGLPPVYPYRLEIKTQGRPLTSAFSIKIIYFDEKSRRFYQVKRIGTTLDSDGQKFTLTNPHFTFLESLEKLSPEIKNPGERLSLWSQIIKVVPKECVLENKELLDFSFIKADRFCLDQKPLSGNDFKIVPELIYTKTNKDEDKSWTNQLPKGISQEFKERFLNTKNVDPYYKVGHYYMQLSEPVKICLKIIKKINKESLEKRRAFYMNPMERIKKEIPESLSEDLLENIFFETDHFKSDRISYLGQWIPKLGIYIDPDNKNPWIPQDDIALKMEDSLFHFSPDDLDTVIKNLEQKQKSGEDTLIYKGQAIPVTDELISEIKRVKSNIFGEAEKIKPSADNDKKNIKLY